MPKRLLLTALVAVVAVFALAGTANAETGKKALILNSSVTGGPASSEATRATNLGFTVTLATDAEWLAMTAAQFADYQLLVVGDPTCSGLSPVVSQNAGPLADAVMARGGGSVNTKAGNRLLIGTDPRFHLFQGGNKLIDAGIDFAGVQEGASGLYLDFSCFDPDYDGNGVPDGQDKLLPLLTIDTTPNWTQDTGPPCGGDVSLISNAAQFSSLTSADLRGWGCSVHEAFPTFPSDWSPLALATDTTDHPTCGNDVDTGAAVCGEAYLLIAGSGIVTTSPNLSLAPPTATNTVGDPHTVTATVTNPGGSPAGIHVTFIVTGDNAGAVGVCNPVSCDTDATGHVTFTYTGTNPGDDTINASATISGSTQTATAAKHWVAVGGDGTPPSCTLFATVTGPPKQIQIMVQDTGSGLATILVTQSNNADTVVPPFTPGTNDPVVVTSTKIDQTKASTVALRVTDVAGNVTECDPVVPGKLRRAHAGGLRLTMTEYLRLARLRR